MRTSPTPNPRDTVPPDEVIELLPDALALPLEVLLNADAEFVRFALQGDEIRSCHVLSVLSASLMAARCASAGHLPTAVTTRSPDPQRARARQIPRFQIVWRLRVAEAASHVSGVTSRCGP